MKQKTKQSASDKPARGRPSRRPQILAATEKLLRSQGLTAVTTRAIAAEAGCSEAAIYVHFKGRLELFLAVLEENLPNLVVSLRELENAAGKSTPHKNLDRVARAIFDFHSRVVPMVCSLFAEPALLAAYRDSVLSRAKGPHPAIVRMRKYIREEQKLGRLDKKIDADFAACTLMASSFFRAFSDHFLGREDLLGISSKSIVESVLGKPS
jgi:AcrR family transcriptional regulator